MFTTKENVSYGSLFFIKFVLAGSGSLFLKQLDPGPHSEKLLDPDPKKIMRIHSPASDQYSTVDPEHFDKDWEIRKSQS